MNWQQEFMKMQMYREALASVSLSHRENCTCLTCRAAMGDEQAFRELLPLIQEEEERRE